jgi:hypothetical protein
MFLNQTTNTSDIRLVIYNIHVCTNINTTHNADENGVTKTPQSC